MLINIYWLYIFIQQDRGTLAPGDTPQIQVGAGGTGRVQGVELKDVEKDNELVWWLGTFFSLPPSGIIIATDFHIFQRG